MTNEIQDSAQIGFTAEAVAPGELAKITCKPMAPFRGQKLIVMRGMMAFELAGIMVDGVECMPTPRLNWADRLVLWWHSAKTSPRSIPCICFAAETLGNGMIMPVASETLQLRVRNTSSESADFVGALYGQRLR